MDLHVTVLELAGVLHRAEVQYGRDPDDGAPIVMGVVLTKTIISHYNPRGEFSPSLDEIRLDVTAFMDDDNFAALESEINEAAESKLTERRIDALELA